MRCECHDTTIKCGICKSVMVRDILRDRTRNHHYVFCKKCARWQDGEKVKRKDEAILQV